MSVRQFAFVLIGLFLQILGSSATVPCKYTVGGTTYDLSSIGGKSYSGSTPDSSLHVKLMFCDVLPDAYCKPDSALCRAAVNPPDELSFASWTQSPLPIASPLPYSSEGFMLTFANSEKNCYDPGLRAYVVRNVEIIMTCGSLPGLFEITELTSPVCHYRATFPSPAACSNSGLSGGAIFLIVLLICISVYWAVGCAICCIKYGKRGVDACPNKNFWFSLPGLVKDGCVFFFSKLFGLCSSKSSNNTDTNANEAGDYGSI